MKKIIAGLAVFASILFQLKAQEIKNSQASVCGGFTIGYGNMDVSKLRVFVPSYVNSFRSDHLLIGGTGHGFLGNFVIGGSGFAIVGDKVKTDTLQASVAGGMGTFDVGYLILNRDKIKLYPMIGIGGSGFGLQIVKNKNVSAGNVASDPYREINISVGGFVVDVSLNLNLIPVLAYDEKENSYGGFMTGLKVGYVYSLPSSDWKFSGGDVTGGPNFGLNMVYVKLILGGFGFQNAAKH